MTWEQIKEIEQTSFAVIGHHSHTHDYLIDKTNKEFILDIETANNIWRIFKIYERLYFSKFQIIIWPTFRSN